MNQSHIKSLIPAGLLVGMLVFSGCHSAGYSLSSVEGGRIEITAALESKPDSKAVAILAPYKAIVDSIMLPVIGHSTAPMRSYRPESELSNLVADVLRFSTINYIGRVADVGVTNMGGLRGALPEGEIRYGNIYEITPFENTLNIVTMDGKMLRKLFESIASVRGEGLSGAKLVITQNGKLVSATVGGKDIDDNRQYKVATLDYLAEGNDRMDIFSEVPDTDKYQPEGAILRELFLNYVAEQTKKGKSIESKVEGRITIKE